MNLNFVFRHIYANCDYSLSISTHRESDFEINFVFATTY